jgi:threonyl-tRNA synthetase
MERVHQCATVQLDFQLPIRFDLNYRGDAQVEATTTPTNTAAAASEQSNSDAMDVDTDGNTTAASAAAAVAAAVKPKGVSKNRPVMVHRAMLGSLERMIAVLTEHYGGRWPFWLSPRQAMVVPVGQVNCAYSKSRSPIV